MHKRIFLVLIISLIFVYFVFGKYGIYHTIKLEIKRRSLERRILIMNADMIIMKHKMKLLEDSDDEKERIAREKLGMLKNSEKIIIMEEEWKR